MLMLKFLFLFLISVVLSLLLVGNVFADTTCQPIYGGGQTCITTGNLIINKMVQDPLTGQFVDNINVNSSSKFVPGQTINFQLNLTNSGNSNILQVAVKDTLPAEVTFVSGPGNFDVNSRTLTFTTDNLAAGQTRTFSVEARANDINQGTVCVVNQATATGNNGQTSQDNSSFCIQKGALTKGGLPVFPPPKVFTTPPTGPELIPLIGLLPAGLSGWFLRRKSGRK